MWRCGPTRAMASSFMMFLDHTQRRITVGRTPLDDRSARRRDLYLTTHNTHNRQTSMPSVGFETKISAGERPQTYALDRTATGSGIITFFFFIFFFFFWRWTSFNWRFWPFQRHPSTLLYPGHWLSNFWSSFDQGPVRCCPPIYVWVFLLV